MPHFEDHFQTRDRLKLFESRWLPEGDVRGVVVFLHGVIEHSGRYVELFETLNRHGYAVWAIDLRGHGKSQGRRVYVHSFDEYLDDVELLASRAGQGCPGKPLFLMGHSMGAAVVLLLAIDRGPQAAGVVASAPPVRVGGAVFPVLRHVASKIGQLFPRLRLVSLGSSMLSRDPEVVEQFRDDPLVFHDPFPVRTGSEVLRAGHRIRRGMDKLRTPLLILHGTGDAVTNPKGSRQLAAGAASADKTLKIYDGLYHDLFHEPEKARITADLIAWLDGRVNRPTARGA